MVTLLGSNPLGLAKISLHLRTAMHSGRVHETQSSGMEDMSSFIEHFFGGRFVKVTDL